MKLGVKEGRQGCPPPRIGTRLSIIKRLFDVLQPMTKFLCPTFGHRLCGLIQGDGRSWGTGREGRGRVGKYRGHAGGAGRGQGDDAEPPTAPRPQAGAQPVSSATWVCLRPVGPGRFGSHRFHSSCNPVPRLGVSSEGRAGIPTVASRRVVSFPHEESYLPLGGQGRFRRSP